jgi:hypothetical protein
MEQEGGEWSNDEQSDKGKKEGERKELNCFK